MKRLVKSTNSLCISIEICINNITSFKYKHLPDIPSALQMEKDGVEVAEMNKLLLQKIEELTLYVIELKKENDKIKQLIGDEYHVVE